MGNESSSSKKKDIKIDSQKHIMNQLEVTEEKAKARPCWVRNCKYFQNHLTSAHRCGTCWGYGHGKVECRDSEAKESLRRMISLQLNHYDQLMPVASRCSLRGCSHPYSHRRSSHHCSYCGLRADHLTKDCHYRRDGWAPPPYPRKKKNYDPDRDHYDYESDDSSVSDDDNDTRFREQAVDNVERESEYWQFLEEHQEDIDEAEFRKILYSEGFLVCKNADNPFHECSGYCKNNLIPVENESIDLITQSLKKLNMAEAEPSAPELDEKGGNKFPIYTCPVCREKGVKGIEILDNKDNHECLMCWTKYTDKKVDEKVDEKADDEKADDEKAEEKTEENEFIPMLGLHPNNKIGHSICLDCINTLNSSTYQGESTTEADC